MTNQSEGLLHGLDKPAAKVSTSFFLILIAGMLIVGTAIGFGLSKMKSSASTSNSATNTSNSPDKGKTVGIADKSTFKDSAEGILRDGGIKDEGSFHLERPGGDSQNVYLTSSTVDLSQFIGKKVKVWGQTMNAKYAGWLMDVGLVEVQ